MRTNPTNQLPIKPKDSARGVLGITAPFVPRDRVAGEATPRVVTVMHPRNIYRPAKHNTDGLRVSL
jgi:hypothetical protein